MYIVLDIKCKRSPPELYFIVEKTIYDLTMQLFLSVIKPSQKIKMMAGFYFSIKFFFIGVRHAVSLVIICFQDTYRLLIKYAPVSNCID